MIAALILTAALTAPSNVGTTPDGDVGWETADGTIVTEEVYNDWFADPFAEFDAMEYMFGVTSKPLVEVDVSVPAAERPREFMGEELPTVRQLFEHWRVR